MAGIQESVPTPCQTLLMELPFYEVADWLLGTKLPDHNSPLLLTAQSCGPTGSPGGALRAVGVWGRLLAASSSGCYPIVRQSLQGQGWVWTL